MKSARKREIHFFRSAAEFRKWLAANHRQADGIWLRISKKNSTEPSVTYAEALDEALCFGWIDGQKQPHDETSWLQGFSGRRAKSGWSKINTKHAERLIAKKRMKAAGQAEIDAARRTAGGRLRMIHRATRLFRGLFGCVESGQKGEGVFRVAE